MTEEKAWRNPDITMAFLVRYLGTNRTTLAKVIQEQGYENYSSYINQYRINDFIEIIRSGESDNFQNVFYDVGFRSRATALRNFKQFTGMTPSEYMKEHNISENGVLE